MEAGRLEIEQRMQRWDDNMHRTAPKADRTRTALPSMCPCPCRVCLMFDRYCSHFDEVQMNRGGRGARYSLSRCLAVFLVDILPNSASALSTFAHCHGATATVRVQYFGGWWLWRDDAATATRRDCVLVSACGSESRDQVSVAQPSLDRIRSDPVLCWVPSIKSWQSPRYA